MSEGAAGWIWVAWKCPAENQLEQGAASFKMFSAASGTNGGFVDAVGFDVGVDLRTFVVKQWQHATTFNGEF